MIGLSPRAIIIGLIGVVAACFIVSYAVLVISGIQLGILQFPPGAVGLLFFIIIVNAAIKKFSRRLGLSPAEIMIIYCMILVATFITSRGMMEKLLPPLVAVNYFATPTNDWRGLFFKNIRKWMVPFDTSGSEKQDIATTFYEGLHHGEPIPWKEWITPLCAWGILVLIVFFIFICLATILRRQWVDNEKLAFPLVQPPLEMVREETAGPFLRNKLTWVGFAIPTIIFTLNGLHMLQPSLPEIPVQHNLSQYFLHRPWNQMEGMAMFFSFAAIGFSYLLPSDLLFSLWFFFVFSRLQDVIAAAFGMEAEGMPLYPGRIFRNYQALGAYLVLTAYLLRTGLPHLKLVVRKALFKAPEVDDSQEFLPYPVAFWGLLIGTGLSIFWCYLAGMSLWLAFIEMIVYLYIVVLVMARSVAEGGLLMTESSFRPIDIVTMFTSKHSLGPSNLTALSFMDVVFPRDLRGLVLTGLLDGLKISDEVKIKRRQLLIAFTIAIIIALLTAGGLHLWFPYRRGAVTLYNYVYTGNCVWGFQDYEPHFRTEMPFNWNQPIFFALGVIFTIFLAFMRANYYWWPLHPLGYALCCSWTMIVFWFPVFVAWLIKTFILRYGGMKLYVRARPLFLGLIIGEFSMAVLWATFSCATKSPAPFFPWP